MPTPARYGSAYPCGLLLISLHDRTTVVARPVVKGALIQASRVAEDARSENHPSRLLADVAVRHDGVTGFDASIVEDPGQPIAIDEPLSVGDVGERDVDGARYMPRLAVHPFDALIVDRG